MNGKRKRNGKKAEQALPMATSVAAGDGVQIRQEDSVNITALSESEFLLFNLNLLRLGEYYQP